MAFPLVIVFLFQAVLAFAFTWFMSNLLLQGEREAEPPIDGFRRIRSIAVGANLILPSLLFLIYRASLPEGASISPAVIASLWAFLLLLGISSGLSLAIRGGARSLKEEND
jgi:hypothetical protein